jgi:uncharacterized protein (DUF2141 family)
MKTMIICIILLITLIPSPQAQHQLDIEITGIRNDNGRIMLQMMDENQEIVKQEISPIREKTSRFLLKDVTPGKYGIRYFHDENGNGEIDTSAIGRPVEGYGFSNNLPVRLGQPKFEKWLFELKEDTKMVLTIIY